MNVEKVITFMKEKWGASDVIVLGDPDNAMWVYYRGGHATSIDADAQRDKVESSLITFMMEHGDFEQRVRDGHMPVFLCWQDHRCATRWPFRLTPRPYRAGEICRVSDTIYSHAGSTYTVFVDQGDGRHRLELRELPGFDEIERRFNGKGLLASLLLGDRSRFDNATKQAAELLSAQYEDEYWDAVADFLVAWHERIEAKARMIDVLRAAGFSEHQISDAGLGFSRVPIEAVEN